MSGGAGSTAPASSTATGTATPSPSPGPASLASCPAAVDLSSLAPLARASVDIDDLTVDATGDIWITAVDAGQIIVDDAAGHEVRRIADPHGPEGIVPIPGGGFALAEQKANRVVRLDPATGTTTPLLDVPNHTQQEGVDGLAFDARRSRLLVPDSANGRLLALPLSAAGAAAGPAKVLATGLGRPVAAWPETDGSVDVGVEGSPGLVRVPAGGGAARPLVAAGRLGQVDEVLGEGPLLYVTDLLRSQVIAVDPGTGRTAALVVRAADPQGLALLPDGRLLLVESTTRVLAAVDPC